LLAPSKEASGLAILEAIIRSYSIAFTASITDSNFSGHATFEFVMVDATQTKGVLATLVALVTERVVVQGLDFGLIVGCALHCTGLEARCGRASWDSCACWKVSLGGSCAVEAALLAPSKEASGLAVFEAIVGSGGIAVTASIADADFAGHATLELGMVDAAQAKGALATLVALVTECVVIQGLDLGLIIG